MKRFLNWKWGVGLAAGLALAGWGYFSIAGRAAGQEAAVDGDNIVTVFVGDLAASATASGQVEARRRARLSVGGSARVEQIYVEVGDEVRAGDLLMQLDQTDPALNVRSAAQNLRTKEAALADLVKLPTALEMAAAEAELASAQAAYDDLLTGPSVEEIAISQASVTQANASLYSSSVQYSDILTSITAADLETARAELVAAEFDLEQAQEINDRFANQRTHDSLRAAEEAYAEAAARYERLSAGVEAADLSASQADVTAAAARRDRSQANLDDLLTGPSAQAIASAENNLAQAEASLAALVDGPTDAEIAIAKAEVAQATLNLADAEARLEETRILAPFDGIITGVYFAAGEIASGGAVEIVDMRSLEVILSVDEADLNVINIGQPAEITLEAWPTSPIASQVIAIAPTAADNGSGIVAYDVHVSLGESDLPVRLGLTADARLITAERPDVLLIPNAAIRVDRQTNNYYVNLLEGETIIETEITIGLRDNTNTQVLAGVEAGERLVIDYQAPVTDAAPGPGGGPFGN